MDHPIPPIGISPAREDDAPVILEMIRELATYEKLAHEVVGNVEELRSSLFGERPSAEVILARDGDRPVGFALFFHNYSTFLCRRGLYVEDLFVRPEARGRGVGRALFAALAKLARDRDCGRMEWWVLDWNESAIGFYRGLGAQAMDDWTVYRLGRDEIDRLAAES